MMDKRMLAGALFCWSLNASAIDFSKADAKFAKRDIDLATTLEARAAYKEILDFAAKNEDKLRAAEGYLRTWLFEGTHYHSLDTEEGRKARKVVFSSCWSEAAEAISPTALGFASPVYYYFRSACLAYDAQVSTFPEQLELVPRLVTAIEQGIVLEGGTRYEAGGLYRVAAAVKYNPAAKPLPGGLYNPQEALFLIDQAIAASAFPETNIPGSLYCENFSHKVRNLIVLERYGEALNLAGSSLGNFQNLLKAGALPEFVRAETLDCIALLTELKGAIQRP